jgi:hypothetical protein
MKTLTVKVEQVTSQANTFKCQSTDSSRKIKVLQLSILRNLRPFSKFIAPPPIEKMNRRSFKAYSANKIFGARLKFLQLA